MTVTIFPTGDRVGLLECILETGWALPSDCPVSPLVGGGGEDWEVYDRMKC